ncbi:hypothetical protein ACS0TY_022776 [Phlomoides rotata]
MAEAAKPKLPNPAPRPAAPPTPRTQPRTETASTAANGDRISKSLNKPYGLQDCITNGLTGQHDNDTTMNPDTTILPAGFVIEVFLNMLAW